VEIEHLELALILFINTILPFSSSSCFFKLILTKNSQIILNPYHYLNPINHMPIKTHYIAIIPIITENKNNLSSIKVKYFLRHDKNFTNIDFGI
jgi:hypothetical protein